MTEKPKPGWIQRIFRRGQGPLASGLTCRQMVELMTSYLEAGLSADDRARFEQHLGACANCTRYLEQMRQTITATGALHEDDLRPEAREALLTAFRDWKRES